MPPSMILVLKLFGLYYTKNCPHHHKAGFVLRTSAAQHSRVCTSQCSHERHQCTWNDKWNPNQEGLSFPNTMRTYKWRHTVTKRKYVRTAREGMLEFSTLLWHFLSVLYVSAPAELESWFIESWLARDTLQTFSDIEFVRRCLEAIDAAGWWCSRRPLPLLPPAAGSVVAVVVSFTMTRTVSPGGRLRSHVNSKQASHIQWENFPGALSKLTMVYNSPLPCRW